MAAVTEAVEAGAAALLEARAVVAAANVAYRQVPWVVRQAAVVRVVAETVVAVMVVAMEEEMMEEEKMEAGAAALLEARAVVAAANVVHCQVPWVVRQAMGLMAAEQMALATKEVAGWEVARVTK